MADANIELKSENPFMVGGFKMQSSTKTTKTSNVIANDASGFVILEDNISKQSDYTQSMTYCGSNFLTDAPTTGKARKLPSLEQEKETGFILFRTCSMGNRYLRSNLRITIRSTLM
jgi:hypothetical protein